MAFSALSRTPYFPANRQTKMRCRTRQASRCFNRDMLITLQQILNFYGRVFLCTRYKQPALADYRLFHKVILKLGIKKSVKQSKQYLQEIVSLSRSFPKPSLKAKTNKRLPIGIPSEIFDFSSSPHTTGPEREHETLILVSEAACAALVKAKYSPRVSMTRRRLASNLPTVQLNLSFHMPKTSATNTGIDMHISGVLPVDPCSTPITPLDKILHTPANPPLLERPDVRKSPSINLISTPENTATCSSPSNYIIRGCTLSRVSENIRRRLSVVAPPEAVPMHAPRRLSYSHTYGKPRSPPTRRAAPMSSEMLNSCAETDLLASPLVIFPSSSGRRSVGWFDENSCGSDLYFSSMGSPLRVKV